MVRQLLLRVFILKVFLLSTRRPLKRLARLLSLVCSVENSGEFFIFYFLFLSFFGTL